MVYEPSSERPEVSETLPKRLNLIREAPLQGAGSAGESQAPGALAILLELHRRVRTSELALQYTSNTSHTQALGCRIPLLALVPRQNSQHSARADAHPGRPTHRGAATARLSLRYASERERSGKRKLSKPEQTASAASS